MDLELWAENSAAISAVAAGFERHPRDQYSTALIVRVYHCVSLGLPARSAGQPGYGYLLGDAPYDASWIFDHCHGHNHQLLCPRAKPGVAWAR